MKTINRIRFFDTNSALVRCYGISRRITTADGTGSYTYRLGHIDKLEEGRDTYYGAGIAEARKAFIEILKINGISWVLIREFEINVKIENAFDWSDVHDDVIAIIKAHLFADIDVDVQDATKGTEINEAWENIASGATTVKAEKIVKP